MRHIFALVLLLFFAGCAALPRSGVPRTAPSVPVSDKPVVVTLADVAHTEAEAGRLDEAAATLERALRIEPRNATLWQRLASVRLAQGETAQAIQLAQKSLSLAGDNRALRAADWRVIGEAYTQRGEDERARLAFAKAAEFGR